jgi:large subunit ribosomal protein L37Ae
MAIEKKLGSVKRFGPRYGRKIKEKLANIELEHRKLQKCPYCNHTKVKRLSAGIWYCKKCESKFTGKAYSIKKKITFEEKGEEEAKESS